MVHRIYIIDFLENSRALSKFMYGILHHLINIIKLYKNQSIKKQFHFNHASHLKKMRSENIQ